MLVLPSLADDDGESSLLASLPDPQMVKPDSIGAFVAVYCDILRRLEWGRLWGERFSMQGALGDSELYRDEARLDSDRGRH